MPISPYRLVISLMQIYKPVLRPTMMTTDFPDLGLKVMISNTPSEITPRQQTSHGRLTETRRQPKTLKKKNQQHSIWEHQESQCHTGVGRGQSRRGYVAGSTVHKVEDRRPEEDCANGEDNTGPYCTRRRRLLLADTRKN
jgi:hypothetical protein